jgi:hypothetical protein
MIDHSDQRQDEQDPWLRTYFTNRLGALDRDRVSYWKTWRQLAEQFAPRRGRFLYETNDQYMRGARKDRRIIDNTPLLERPVAIAEAPRIESYRDLAPAQAAVTAAVLEGEIGPREATAVTKILETDFTFEREIHYRRQLDALVATFAARKK